MALLGWTLLVVAGFVVALCLLLVAILASPFRLHGRADEGGLTAVARWFGVRVDVDTRRDRLEVRLLRWRILGRPLRSGPESVDDVEARETRAAGSAEHDAEKPTKSERRRRREPRLSWAAWRRLLAASVRELKRTLHLVHVERFRLAAVVASDDPALTGELYGYGYALASALRGVWPDARVDLGADFVATTPRGSAELALRLRPIRLSGPAVRLAWAYLKERRRARAFA